MNTPGISQKSRLATTLLCIFFGVFGAHRFYVGKHGTAVLQLLTFGCLGIWTMVDLILILVGVFRDIEGQRVFLWMEPMEFEINTEVQTRLQELERRLTDTQDIIIALDEKLDRFQPSKPELS